jgi:hypothetical protein
MFDLLSKELELTAEQTERIQERRYNIHEWVHGLIESIRYETISVLCFCILPLVPFFLCGVSFEQPLIRVSLCVPLLCVGKKQGICWAS